MDNIDYTRELDKVKAEIFLGSDAAFLGSLMCSLKIKMEDNEEFTAATDGVSIIIGQQFFMKCDPDTRKFMLLHELWHVARLHMLRCGTRDGEIWNQACDYRINYDLWKEGYKFDTDLFFFDEDVGDLCEEDIYDLLYKKELQKPPQTAMGSDLQEPEEVLQKTTIVNQVVQATQQAKLAGAGDGSLGKITTLVSKFLEPVVPWQSVLHEFFTELGNPEYSWKRPNKRHQDIYLPGKINDDTRLDHLMYYIDVSGSVSDNDVFRFNSEFKYIKETYNPVKLTLVQFDWDITREDHFDELTPFDKVITVGRGGTNLDCVRRHIIQNNPTAAVIFSDLDCTPMEKLPKPIPVIWVVVSNPNAQVNFGKMIHI